MDQIIKNIGNKVKNNELYLHPNTLLLNKVYDEDNYPTKYYLKNDKIFYDILSNKYKENNKKSLIKYMLYPSTVLVYNEILNFYDIISYEDLFDKIKELISYDKPYNSINRVLNCWIRSNYKDLKKNNKILINIYIHILEYYYPSVDIDKIELENEINRWFISHKQSNFELNLGDHIIKSLKIYKKN
jgi:hypothetical protein